MTQKRESDFSYFHCGPFGTDLQVIVRRKKVILSLRGRPFDILGAAWVIFQKKFLSLVLKEKNNLSLKRVKKK